MEKRFLLGTIENKIVIANVCLYENRNCEKEFTASFSIGEGFDIDNMDSDYGYDYWNDYFEEMDSDIKLELLDGGEITKYDWIEKQCNDTDYRDIKDCSSTDLEMEFVNSYGEEMNINFESTCGGQHDIREESGYENMKFTDKKAVEDLLFLWDNYHLKSLKDNYVSEVIYEKVLSRLSDFEFPYGENVEKFIQDNLELD